MKKLVICLALALCSAGAFAKSQVDTLVISTSPQMHCENCENKIKKNVRFVKGTKEIVTSIDEQKVTIVYDGKKASFEDYVAAFRKIGYEIRKQEENNPAKE